MKIKLSKSQWEGIGKKAGWIRIAQPAPSMAQQIPGAFSGLAGGINDAGKAKVQEYAQRIMNGEPKDQVLQGAAPTMIKNVEQVLSQMSQKPQQPQQPQQTGQPLPTQTQQKTYTSQQIVDWSRQNPDPSFQKSIARLMSGNDPQQISALNRAINGDPESQKWLTEYIKGMKTSYLW